MKIKKEVILKAILQNERKNKIGAFIDYSIN